MQIAKPPANKGLILTQKGEIRRRMADELDERLPHRLSDDRMGGDDVGDGEEREQYPDPDDLEGLEHHVFPPESGQPLVPYRRQELLNVGVGHELENKIYDVFWELYARDYEFFMSLSRVLPGEEDFFRGVRSYS